MTEQRLGSKLRSGLERPERRAGLQAGSGWRTEQPLGAELRLGWAGGPGLSGGRGGGQG